MGKIKAQNENQEYEYLLHFERLKRIIDNYSKATIMKDFAFTESIYSVIVICKKAGLLFRKSYILGGGIKMS